MFIAKHFFLRRSFDLSRLGMGSASPNPCVGSVIFNPKKSQIIGEGWHKKYGFAHAEVNAVASVDDKNLLDESTIYVTLEPCFHYGKTPPCVDLILDKKIPDVAVAFTDTNPKVGGKSITKMRENNVAVTLYSDENQQLTQSFNYTLKPFFTNIQKKRPYIILKWAETQDHFLGVKNQRLQISNSYSKRLVHKWRSECDAILVGTTTALVDNPALDNRFYFGKSPVRIVLDKDQKLGKNLHLLDKKTPTWVYTEGVNANENNNNLMYKNVAFDDKLLENILTDMHLYKIGILLVEGGSSTLQHFIDSGFWDEARVLRNKNMYLRSEKGAIPSPILSNEQCYSQQPLDDNELLVFTKNEA